MLGRGACGTHRAKGTWRGGKQWLGQTRQCRLIKNNNNNKTKPWACNGLYPKRNVLLPQAFSRVGEVNDQLFCFLSNVRVSLQEHITLHWSL